MSEIQNAGAGQGPAGEQKKGRSPATHEQKQKRRKLVRRVVTLAVVAAVAAGGTWALRKYVFKSEEDGEKQIMTQPVYRSSIQSKVSGTGNARAKKSATVAPEGGSRVLELFVAEGDYVEEGQPLYTLDDTPAQEAIQAARDNVKSAEEGVQSALEGVKNVQENVDRILEPIAEYNKEIAKLQESMSQLTITAPHAGKLMDVNTGLKPGTDALQGDAVATIVNDTKLRLSLYYSWAYEGQISVGQAAQISLPASMSSVPGTVEQINYVRRIVPEGSVMFEVIFVLNNPGTLTEGTAASAALTDSHGDPIYPYQSGSLEYYETTKVTVKVAGPVLSASLMNYADVKAGQVLVRLGDSDLQDQIDRKRESIRDIQQSAEEARKGVETAQKSVETARKAVVTAQEAVVEAEKKLESYHAVAPISGRILSCGLMEGAEVNSGDSIYIADTATMMVDINIDERNIGYVSKGMFVDMQDQMGNYYMGIIDQVSLTAKAENGVATFPATVVVDNPEGLLMTGSYMNYTFVASQSNDCLVVPIQAVKNVTLADGQDVYGPDDFNPDDYAFDYEPSEEEDAGDLTGDGDVGFVDDFGLPAEGEGLSGIGGVDAAGLEIIEDNSTPGAIAVAEPWFGGSVMGPSAFRNSGTATVCFVQGEADERAIEAQEGWDMPEGFFAVLVETGLSDESNVEIKSGLREGDVVFTGYLTDSANNWGMYG